MANVEKLKIANTFHDPNKKIFLMDWKESLDIDDMQDWEMGEFLFEYFCKKNSNENPIHL